ncbi:hypothetical protein [Seonamhaeicola maritimus]|uniref:Uncharacterized protein n=1 Tax=Seonamhaeicola maritimus TaxID=2591822 RepID=A0A5C7GEF0_9FLAO|nr:hypothetical protein [Seonamhaeicola maritimus]TXG35144.1 hypothetical protein FUA22_15425 [Seonamhaeicola maritimus]
MKNIKLYIILCGILLSISACEEQEYADYTAPDELSDVSWLIGTQPFVNDPFSINVDTHMPFMDLSQGAVSHEWIIEEGNKYLNTGFTSRDSILDEFVKEDVGLTLSDPKAFVLFRNSGFNKVRLLNKFNEKVTYKSSEGNFEAVQGSDGLWVIDTTFTFDVFAKILPAFSISKDGAEVLNITGDQETSIEDEASWPTVEIEAATGLTYMDNTTIGRPNATTWIIPDGVPNQVGGQEQEIKFFKLGTFNAGTIRSQRINELPRYVREKVIPLKVKVIQSSQPFEFDGAFTENEDEVIRFRVNGEVVPFSGEEGNFTVHVTNSVTGFDQNIDVVSARVSEDNAIFIELILSQPIYNSDEVTVSYNGSGSIESADERPLGAFGPENVMMHFGGNIIPEKAHASFEQPSGAANRAFALNYFTGNNNILGGGNFAFERVTTKSSDGDASMKWSTPASNPLPNVNLWSFGLARIAPIPAGTYRITYDLFIEPGTTLKTFRTEFNKPTFSRQVWNIENEPRGEWITVSNTFTTAEITPAQNLRYTFRPHAAENPGVTGAQVMYIDNLKFIEIEERP